MKNPVANLLFELLNRSLAPQRHITAGEPAKTLEHPSHEEWLRLIDIAERNEVSGLAYDAISSLPKEQRPDFETLMRWTAAVQSTERDNLLRREMWRNTIGRLKEEGLQPTLMKGLSLNEFYPNPLHRPVGDIDLFVPIDKQRSYLNCMSAMGGTYKDMFDAKHVTVTLDNHFWELHFRSQMFYSRRTDRRYHLLEMEETAPDSICHQTIEGHEVQVFPPMLNVVFLTAHFQHHLLMEQVTLRQVVDWMLAIHHDRTALAISEVKLVRTLRQLGLYRLYRAMGYIAVHRLGYSAEGYAGLTKFTPTDKVRGHLLLDTLLKGHVPGCQPVAPRLATDGWLARIKHYIQLCRRCLALSGIVPREAMAAPFGFLWYAYQRRRSTNRPSTM